MNIGNPHYVSFAIDDQLSSRISIEGNTKSYAIFHGFAGYNGQDEKKNHLLIDLSHSQPDYLTISIKTPTGRRLSIALTPDCEGVDFQCADIIFHDSGLTAMNGERKLPVMCAALRCGPTGKVIALAKPEDQCTCVVLNTKRMG